jgi:hypothetical protein
MLRRQKHVSTRRIASFPCVLSQSYHLGNHGQQIPALPERVHKRDTSSFEQWRYTIQSPDLKITVSSGTFQVGFLRHGSPHVSFVFSNSTFRPHNASKGSGLVLMIQYKSFPKHYENINFCKTSRGFSCSKISLKMKSYETDFFFFTYRFPVISLFLFND